MGGGFRCEFFLSEGDFIMGPGDCMYNGMYVPTPLFLPPSLAVSEWIKKLMIDVMSGIYRASEDRHMSLALTPSLPVCTQSFTRPDNLPASLAAT